MDDPNKPIWVVGEFPSVMDMRAMRAFSDTTGEHLHSMLDEAGIPLGDCFMRTLIWERPRRGDPANWYGIKSTVGIVARGERYVLPHIDTAMTKLLDDIHEHKPRIVIGCGNCILTACFGTFGANNWRGSMLQIDHEDGTYTKFMPIITPSMSMKMWEWRYLTVQDLKRIAPERFTQTYLTKPKEDFVIRPSYEQVMTQLDWWLDHVEDSVEPLSFGVDVETRFRHITCLGIADSPLHALCIPFASHGNNGSYWTMEEEVAIIMKLQTLLTHPNFWCVGQNYIYDRQYIARDWGMDTGIGFDNQVSWHVAFPGLKKSLAFICSLVLPFYRYWKDEGKGHAPDPDKEDQYWTYNCKDAAHSLELEALETEIIEKMGLQGQYAEQMALQEPVFRAQLKGFRQDLQKKSEFSLTLMEMMAQYDQWFMDTTHILMGDIALAKSKTAKQWWRSPTQQAKLFYEVYKVPVVRHPKTRRPTCNDDALKVIGKREPLLQPWLTKLQEYRSLGVFLNNFVLAKLDWDNRMRCSFGIGMAETFRFTSSEDCFGFGTNLQNLPKGNKLDD